MRCEAQKDLCLETNLRHPLADVDYHGNAFEGVVILRTFCRPTVLSTVFKFHGTLQNWAHTWTQIAGRLGGRCAGQCVGNSADVPIAWGGGIFSRYEGHYMMV